MAIIIKKDPDMAGLKQRMAALEAAHTDLGTMTQKSDFDALSERVTNVEHEIDNDDLADPAIQPAVVEQPPVS